MSIELQEPSVAAWGKRRIVWIDSRRIEASLEAFERSEADGIGISPHNGFLSTDIGFLNEATNLRGLVIPFPKEFDLSSVQTFSQLRFLVLGAERAPLDLSGLVCIEELGIALKAKDVLPQNSKLSHLRLRNFSPSSGNFEALPAFNELTELSVAVGSVQSLSGIERFGNLREAEFAYLPKLKTVEAIGKTSIQALHIEACSSIQDFGALAKCQRLRSLRYINCGALRSLAPLRDFKALEEFRFGKTNVLDGDMTPLMGLKSVGFLNKRHYSHTSEQIDAGIDGRKVFLRKSIVTH